MSFSDQFRRIIAIAQSIAKENGQSNFSAPHLLFGVLHTEAGLEDFICNDLNADIYYLKEWAEVRIEEYPKKLPQPTDIQADLTAEKTIDEADMVRVLLNEEDLSPTHLLVALSTPGVGFSYDQLRSFPLQRDAILQQLMGEKTTANAIQSTQTSENGRSSVAGKPANTKGTQALLDFCVDKTLLAAEGKIDPIAGRAAEIRTIGEILGRRMKPNVILTGEPGVGKTALVDGLALAIQEQEVPPFLQNAHLFELDNGALVAGASYKGEIEERLKNILQGIQTLDKAILFIDEIHVLLDKNGSFGGAANLLKPVLARGEITLIGATTMEEYTKFIESDDAFARRFEMLKVEEPNDQAAAQMLHCILPFYQQHHSIEVPEETVHAAIRYARRYVKDRRLPDAAIDLIDRTMSSLKLIKDTGAKKLEKYQAEYEHIKKDKQASLETLVWHFRQLKSDFNPIVWSLVNLEEDFSSIEDKKIFLKKLGELYKKLNTLFPFTRTELQEFDVASIVAERTGIPLGKIQTQEKERLLQMPEILKQRVIGQDQAIQAVSDAILESRAGLGKPGQPIGSFFFLGPTGTGKTELAKALASFLFLSESNIIRFDMSEFKEEHSAALLYGAPPGYVGYEEGGLLVNKIRQQPYSIVLFDEIEKAHSSVFDIFLQILDEGKLHDKLGKEGDFSNAIIIFTSNIGSQFIVDSFQNQKTPASDVLLEKMSGYFRPEFLGRITEIVPFAPMTQKMVENIFHIQMRSLYHALEKQNISLEITPEAALHLADKGFNPQYGARPLNGVIRSELRRPLARKIIAGSIKNGDKIKLSLDKKKQLHWA